MPRKPEIAVEYFECACTSVGHVLRADVDEGGDVFVSLPLSPQLGLWGRIVQAFRYVFWSQDVLVGESYMKTEDVTRLKALLTTAERRTRKAARRAESSDDEQ